MKKRVITYFNHCDKWEKIGEDLVVYDFCPICGSITMYEAFEKHGVYKRRDGKDVSDASVVKNRKTGEKKNGATVKSVGTIRPLARIHQTIFGNK